MPRDIIVEPEAGQRVVVNPKGDLKLVKASIGKTRTTAQVIVEGTYVEPAPADPAPAVTAGPTLSGITRTEVRAAWSLSEVATGQVEVRLPGGAVVKRSEPELTFDYKAHNQPVTGLEPCTTYELRVIGKDVAGQSYASAWKGFQTEMRDCGGTTNPTNPPPAPGDPPPVFPPVPPSDGDFPGPTTLSYVPTNSDARPAYLTPNLVDSTWGNEIKRITNVHMRRNAYAKICPWNANGTRIFLGYGNRLLDGATYADLGSIASGVDEECWSNVNPDYMYGTSEGSNAWKRYSVASNSWTTIATIPGAGRIALGNYEGTLSDNDTRAAIVYNTAADGSGTWGVKVINPITGAVISTLPIGVGMEPDSCNISCSGQYVTIIHHAVGSGTFEGTRLYNAADMSHVRQITISRTHSTPGRDHLGRDVLYLTLAGLTAHVLSTGDNIGPLVDTDYQVGHVGYAIGRPGWVYASSTEIGTDPGNDQIFAASTENPGTVEVFCFAHANPVDYDSSPFAVPNRDGTLVMFGSTWGGGTGSTVYGFVVGVDV